jgi:alpha(1,3/1,4) fucosyltransferase
MNNQMNKSIKIMFTDMWFKDIYDNRFTKKFKEFNFNFIVDNKNPDFVIYSIFGNSYLNYPNAKKNFFCWEPINFNSSHHLNNCDYSLSYYSDLKDGKKHFYFSPLLGKFGWVNNFIKDINEPKKIPKKKFCCFVVKNTSFGIGAKLRIEFFKELSKYKKVDSFGGSLRNCDVIIPKRNDSKKWGEDYLNVIGQYKFMITFENINNPGVITEKIINAFKANTIPIYWGNKDIHNVIKKNSFINCHEFKSFQETINYIKKIDSDDELYYSILNKQKIIQEDKNFYINKYKNLWKKVLEL